ncbi:MAG: sugar phosphate isomerase/epimerase [Oscillospiraceae bacterium]|jgi:sugar phosphate isomerase/epimerase|nr:sugar phosphate isomerase/epimerase [Oscillospiraceae bacterium]
MRVYYSTLCKIGSDLSKYLDEMIQYGGDAIELMMDGPEWNEFQDRGQELIELLSEKTANYSIHTPSWDMNLTSENVRARNAALDSYRDSIVFASKLHASHVVIHPGFCYAPTFDKTAARERAGQAIDLLCRFNQEYRVPLLVENVGSCATSIFSQDEYIRFIESFAGQIGCLLDVGHAHMCGWDLPKTIAQLKPYLCAVHLHDNHGDADSHLPIGCGTVPWKSVF